MGLLDDAIREHLELKRRRGADPDEVARQEDEALGDPRGGEFAQPAGPAGAGSEPAEAPFDVAQDSDEEEARPGPGGADEEPEDRPAAYAAPHEPEPAEPAERDEEPWLDDEPIDPPSGQPTAELASAEPAPESDVVRPDDEPGADEDVLEETPEFLQETPEHDRLWFEQKPPRDFDFDS
jgi:hypothetical protein